MSGHSKWSTIKRQKQANDAARGKLFSKLSRAIAIAVKTGGGGSLETNYKLRIAVDAAKAENMPKATIDRAIARASETGDLSEVTYEGFGPNGVQVMIEAATDNKNRTAQEIKSALDRSGGNMGGPGSVAFNFEKTGLIVIKPGSDAEETQLKLIDLDVADIEEDNDLLDVYVPANELYEKRALLEENGFEIVSTELIQRPKTVVELSDSESTQALKLLDSLDELEDVQKVYTNADFNV